MAIATMQLKESYSLQYTLFHAVWKVITVSGEAFWGVFTQPLLGDSKFCLIKTTTSLLPSTRHP